MAKKFLQTMAYGLCCLIAFHEMAKGEDCASITLYPWNRPYIGPWFSMNYTSCKDNQVKLIRQGWGSNDPLYTKEAKVGTHIVIGHLGTNEDWIPKLMVAPGQNTFTCANIPMECIDGPPGRLTHKPLKSLKPTPKGSNVNPKTPKEPTVHPNPQKGPVIKAQ